MTTSPISRIRVVDFETDGDGPPAPVIEVGTCDVTRAEDGTWSVGNPVSYLCGARSLGPEARAVHHITPAMVSGQANFDGRRFVEKLAGTGVGALAAHNASFEGKWLATALGAVPLLCTYKAALRVWPDAPAHKNQVLRYWLEDQGKLAVPPDLAQPSHRAGPDAYVTAHVLTALLRLATVEAMLTWTGEPPLMPRIPIGPQRGQPWSVVDGGFLSWMLRQPTMDPDLKWNAKRELDRRRDELAGRPARWGVNLDPTGADDDF